MSNTMIIHHCGGAGLNIARYLQGAGLANQGSGFCNVVSRFIDTSDNNLGDLPADTFWKVTSDSFDNSTIDGSGGERRTNVAAISSNILKYLDSVGYVNEVVGEYHVVIFSGSGGSGSVLAPLLISNLRKRDIPVLAIMVGDSSNGLSCRNTLNTMATMEQISKVVAGKPIGMLYYNNDAVDGTDASGKENNVNADIYRALTVMSVYLSGDNGDIDSKDMINFLSPDRYSTISIAPNLYTIRIHTGGPVKNNKGEINLIGRTLTLPDNKSAPDVVLLQHKYGTVSDPNVLEQVGDLLPIHMVLTADSLKDEHAMLTTTVNEYDIIMNSIKSSSLSGADEATDNGLVI
jgi:hypothetical protein